MSYFTLRAPRRSPAACIASRSRSTRTIRTRAATTVRASSELVSRALTEKHQLMKAVKRLLKTDYAWEEAWVDGVTAAIMTKRLDTTVEQTKAAIDYLVSKGIPVHRIENMVSINKQILARSVDELKETVEYIEGKGVAGAELVRFLTTNPVILRYGPVDGSHLALRKAGGLDSRSMAKIVTDKAGENQCAYYREGVAFGQSPITMTVNK